MIKTCVILYVAHVIHLNTLYLYILIAKQNFQYDQFFCSVSHNYAMVKPP